MKLSLITSALLVGASILNAGFDFSTTHSYTGGNSPATEAQFITDFWNANYDPDIVVADVIYLGKLEINDSGNVSASFDGSVDISSFVTTVTGGSGDSGTWTANGLVYGMVAKGGSGGNPKKTNLFISENGIMSGEWSVPKGSLSHLTFFTFASVPEPSAVLMALSSLVMVQLTILRRRRTK